MRKMFSKIDVNASEGSMMMEFVIAFPVLIALFFAVAQITQIWMARCVVYYGAKCSARSLLVAHEDEYEKCAKNAACAVLKVIALSQPSGAEEEIIPGWGKVPGSGSVEDKTRVKIDASDPWCPGVTVEFDFPMVMPIAGPMIGWAVNPAWKWEKEKLDATGDAYHGDSVFYPYVTFREKVIVPKPYVTMLKTCD